MLTIIIPGTELWDEKSEEFTYIGDVSLDLEHSLVSLSKWESKFEKPFLGAGEKSDEEIMEYVKTMILTPDFPPEVFSKLSQENLDAVQQYINAKSTATWFHDQPKSMPSHEVITSELIYYWMIAFSIPFECQFWHLNRLFTLIRVCNVKNSKPKKRSPAEMMAERRRINEQRKQQYGTSG